jgi:hypothetical protein
MYTNPTILYEVLRASQDFGIGDGGRVELIPRDLEV